jgi:hypothetical protein
MNKVYYASTLLESTIWMEYIICHRKIYCLDGQNMLKVDFILKQNKDPKREIGKHRQHLYLDRPHLLHWSVVIRRTTFKLTFSIYPDGKLYTPFILQTLRACLHYNLKTYSSQTIFQKTKCNLNNLKDNT